MAPPARRPIRPAPRAGGGGGNVAAGIAISAVLLAAAAGAVLYTRSQDPIGSSSSGEPEGPRRKKPAAGTPEAPGTRTVTDRFTKEATVVPNGSYDLVLSSDRNGQIEFEILVNGGPVDIAMIHVRAADAISRDEQALLRREFKRYEPGGPYVLRAPVQAGEVQYCQIANPGPRTATVTATGRTISP